MPHLSDRPTRTLQDRREVLLTLPRDLSRLENEELQAISKELEQRGVLSIGINF